MQMNEIDEYQEGRFIGATEAIWRIFGFETHGMAPHVERLAIHLPGKQPVVFTEQSSLGVIASLGEPETTLTAWFDLNQRDPLARQMLYHDIPTKYVWHQSGDNKHTWTKRLLNGSQRIDVEPVGRMYFVKPTAGDSSFSLDQFKPKACNSDSIAHIMQSLSTSHRREILSASTADKG